MNNNQHNNNLPQRTKAPRPLEDRFASGSLILGLVGLVSLCIIPMGYVPSPSIDPSLILGDFCLTLMRLARMPFCLSIFGIAAATLSRKNKRLRGFGMAGMILSVIGVILSLSVIWVSVDAATNPEFAKISAWFFQPLGNSLTLP